MKDTQIYGRPPKRHRKEDKKQPRRYDTADFIFLLGTLMAVLFLYRMTGGISSDAELLKTEQEQIAVAVMSTNAAESGGEREILREVTGEPFGYMTGEWNLWEYIGDLMASLLMGGYWGNITGETGRCFSIGGYYAFPYRSMVRRIAVSPDPAGQNGITPGSGCSGSHS